MSKKTLIKSRGSGNKNVARKYRRTAVKTIITGTTAFTITGHWHKPIVQSIVLPAHGALTVAGDDAGSVDN